MDASVRSTTSSASATPRFLPTASISRITRTTSSRDSGSAMTSAMLRRPAVVTPASADTKSHLDQSALTTSSESSVGTPAPRRRAAAASPRRPAGPPASPSTTRHTPPCCRTTPGASTRASM